MKKVLHLTMSNRYGGAEGVIFFIIKNLKDEYDFLFVCPKGPIEKELRYNNIKYKSLKNNNLFSLKRIIKEYNPNVLHGHDFKASFLISFLKSRGKKISHLHTSHPWINKFSLKSLVYAISTINLDTIIIVSNFFAEEISFRKLFNNKIRIMQNPVDKDIILKSSGEYEESKSYDLAYIGRLSDYKNPLNFIEIVFEIKKVIPDIKGVIVGEGELKKECEDLIIKLKLEKNIDLKGYRRNPFPILKKSKILVIPSKQEALPLVAIEGMTLAKPIIASKVGGLQEIVEANGRLCNKMREFVEEILVLLLNEDIYIEKSLKSLELSKKYTNEKLYLKKISYLYG